MFELEYKIILKSNFLTSQTGIIGKEIDASYKRDISGRPVIYGRHIKGILRDKFNNIGLEKIEDINLIEVDNLIFGKEGIYKPSLIFSNLYLENNDFKYNKRYSIKVDRETKVIKEISLFNFEFIEANQEFFGTIKFEREFKREYLKLLLISLFHLDKIGGYKSRGLGNVEIKINLKNEFVGIEKLEEILEYIVSNYNYNTLNDVLLMEEFDFELEFLSPIVLQENKIGNLVTVRNDLQGSTLRGALIQLGLKKGFDIKELLGIEVKLENVNLKLKSEFETKYKTKTGDKLIIDKSIVLNDSFLIENDGNKFQRKSNVDFEDKSDDISIKIYNDNNIETDLFNHQLIENVDNKLNKLYKGSIKVFKSLIPNLEEIIYIGKYKSKGFGKVKIKLINKTPKYNIKEKIINRINKFNTLIKEDKTYITFDLLSDLILPIKNIENVLEYFKNMIKLSIHPESDRSFLSVEKLYGYNIINNIRKGTELIITKGSVLTYSIDNINDIVDKLVEIEKKSLGLRKKEGFGMIRICSDTKARKEVVNV